ncbi:hypothetical protein [Pararhodobacter aggregans]
MDGKRRVIAGSMALSMLWALGLVWWGRAPGEVWPSLTQAFLPGGLVMGLMVGRLAQRRFSMTRSSTARPFAPVRAPRSTSAF